MGVHVVLDIVPQRIDATAWAEAYDDVRKLCAAHPARLYGYGFRIAAGVRVPVFTRAVEQGGVDPVERRICIAGDRASLGVAERQRVYRDLGRYLARSRDGGVVDGPASSLKGHAIPSGAFANGAAPGPKPRVDPRPAIPDLLCAAASSDDVASVRVFGEGEPCEACRMALLAAAMVVETRFPKHAMISGKLDRAEAEAARRWAQGILGRAIALPVRVDAWRLVERLGARFEGEALVRATAKLLLPANDVATLIGLFGRAEIEPWLLGVLRDHAGLSRGAVSPAAYPLLAAYLTTVDDEGAGAADAVEAEPRSAVAEYARLTGLACNDARGPRWPAEAFAAALAALPRVDEAALAQAFAAVFGAGAPRVLGAFHAAAARLTRERRPTTRPPERCARAALVDLTSPGELDALERERIHALALAVRRLGAREAESGGPLASLAPGSALPLIAGLLARGPTMTEDAWEWIEREEDPEMIAFLTLLAALPPADPDTSALRRVLFENRTLCRYAAAVSRDPALMGAAAERAVSS